MGNDATTASKANAVAVILAHRAITHGRAIENRDRAGRRAGAKVLVNRTSAKVRAGATADAAEVVTRHGAVGRAESVSAANSSAIGVVGRGAVCERCCLINRKPVVAVTRRKTIDNGALGSGGNARGR